MYVFLMSQFVLFKLCFMYCSATLWVLFGRISFLYVAMSSRSARFGSDSNSLIVHEIHIDIIKSVNIMLIG